MKKIRPTRTSPDGAKRCVIALLAVNGDQALSWLWLCHSQMFPRDNVQLLYGMMIRLRTTMPVRTALAGRVLVAMLYHIATMT